MLLQPEDRVAVNEDGTSASKLLTLTGEPFSTLWSPAIMRSCDLPIKPGFPPHLRVWRPHGGAVMRKVFCLTVKLIEVFIICQPLLRHHIPQERLERNMFQNKYNDTEPEP